MIKLLKKKLNKKGFTLIELIVVIAIAAVLAVIGIPAIAGQVAKAQQSAAEANAKTIASQAQLLITQAETSGETLVNIKAAADKVKVLAAAGITESKAGDVVIVLEEYDKEGNVVTTGGVTAGVKSVTVTKGSIKGEFTRVAPAPSTGGGGN